MPKFKLFKLLSLTHKNTDSLHRLSSSLPVDTNPVVIQSTRTLEKSHNNWKWSTSCTKDNWHTTNTYFSWRNH